MKQLIIVETAASVNGGIPNANDLQAFTNGSIGFADSKTGDWLAAKPTGPFDIVGRRAADALPIVIPEVPLTVKAVKAAYNTGTLMSKEFIIVAPQDSKGVTINGNIYFDYIVTLTMNGRTLNERINYTYNNRFPKAVTAKKVAEDIVKHFKKVIYEIGLPLIIGNVNEKVTFTALKTNEFFNITLSGAIDDLAVATISPKIACGTAEHVAELAKQCAADRGFEYTYETDQYKGYPWIPTDPGYDIWTLTYSTNPHPAAHTSEEVVNQVVYIAVATGAMAKTDIEKVLNTLQ